MCFTILFSILAVEATAAMTITSNQTGNYDGYDYEYWKDNAGNGTMTLNGGGTFSCSWDNNINNILFRTGKEFSSTNTYQDYGNISISYACNYQPEGISYLGVYGWTKNSLAEYYIIDSYGTFKPPGSRAKRMGTITVDGGSYEIYQELMPYGIGIVGSPYQRYYSIRTTKRTSGTITVSEHFKEWEALGMKLGKLYNVSLLVEGFQSGGKAEVTEMELAIENPNPLVTGIKGDINNDGKINSTDDALLRRHILCINILNGLSLSNADVNSDGKVNSIDYSLIRRYILGKITVFPGQESVTASPLETPPAD